MSTTHISLFVKKSVRKKKAILNEYANVAHKANFWHTQRYKKKEKKSDKIANKTGKKQVIYLVYRIIIAYFAFHRHEYNNIGFVLNILYYTSYHIHSILD